MSEHMVDDAERQRQQSLTKAEKRDLLVGISKSLDQEDYLYWRNATEELRGRTLYRLLARGRALRLEAGLVAEEPSSQVGVLRPRGAVSGDHG